MFSRRKFVGTGLAAMAAACATEGVSQESDGRLVAQPGRLLLPGIRRGVFTLGPPPQPLAYVPRAVDPLKPAPLILLLHGAGQQARGILDRMAPAADRRGAIILAPQSEKSTWDVIRSFGSGGGPAFGADTARVNDSLAALFAQFTVDPAHIAIAGFSDGASYALSLGPRNQQLFTHIMAFSPGGVAPFSDPAKAKVFISHGTQDQILAYPNTAEGIVPGFKSAGFAVEFVTFDGPHQFREPEIAKAMDWFLG